MAIIQSGANPNSLLTVDPTFKAARISTRPPELVGSYAIGASTGTLAGAIGTGVLWSFKYNGIGVCVLRRLRVLQQITVAYTQGSSRLGAYQLRGAYTQGTTNATLVNTFRSNGAKRTTMPPNNVTIWTATTTFLSGDSGTADTHPFGSAALDLNATITMRPFIGMYDLYESTSTNLHPIVLAPTEGIRIQNETSFAATGSSILRVMVEWDEMTSY